MVHEDDVIEFDKSVDCLARAGKFENKTENIYRYDSNSKSNDTYQIEIQDYSVVEDFPFLSPEYNNFKHLLPIDRTFKVLKRIGNDLKKDLELLSLEQLKYEVTKKFFEFIKEYDRK